MQMLKNRHLALLGCLFLTQCEEPSDLSSVGPADSLQIPGEGGKENTPTAAVPVSQVPETVTFNEHVQPILSEYCYHCHGPDESTRAPKDNPLRLDLEDEAFKPRENGKPVIIKGDPEASYMVKLMRSKDLDVIMPPPESHKKLKPEKRMILERWIEQGAEYEDHWSFEAVERPELPESGKDWAINPIDNFIHAKLAEKGLEPNPNEDPARFYRRLHLDLTGLPPSPEDTAAFSWDKLDGEIDRLLATDASAEHFARYWLDAARYADSHGIHIDNYRAIWPYRDWVVRAFKENMTWDQFTIEQIAGDLIDGASLDQKVATGFNRCLPTTGEGGAIAEEYDAIYAQDRTNTTTAVWLGLTAGCAACHDHKFDPISMKDTYAFNAFFRNTTMHAMDRNAANHPPNIFVPLMEDREAFASLAERTQVLKVALDDRRKVARGDFEKWLASAELQPAAPDSSLALQLQPSLPDGTLRGLVDGQEKTWETKIKTIDSPSGPAPLISETHAVLGDLASFSRKDQVTFGGFIRIEGKPTGGVIGRMNRADNFRGWDIYLQGGKIASHVIDKWPDRTNKIIAKEDIAQKTWKHVMVTFDGSRDAKDALRLYIDGVAAPINHSHASVGDNIVSKSPLTIGSRDGGDSKLSGGSVALQDFRFYRRLLTPAEIGQLAKESQIRTILAKQVDQRSKEDNELLFNHYIDSIDPATAKVRNDLQALDREREEIKKRGSATLVMQEKDGEPYAHMLNRGVYSDKGDKVAANTPEFLPPMADDAPRNRLGLAQWMVSKDNPLTARVTMNRLWYQFFGTGIVETVEDFGIMGGRPTHPQLLDWLASEFMDSGWDYRHMVKTIVSSAAYRQSGKVSAEKLEIDPANRLISRGPRYRLDAEVIRDLALASSGLLVEEVGGPPVRPYQPGGVWEAVAMKQSNTRHYKQDTGDKLYRRSIYTFWKRTAPHPAMEILNAPTREVFCVRRELTNTPLQAFVTMNDPQFVEASRHLAQGALTHGDDDFKRIDFISARLINRPLSSSEKDVVGKTLADARKRYGDDPEAAKALISIGDSKPEASLDPSELAAWTIIASQILNLDETLNK